MTNAAMDTALVRRSGFGSSPTEWEAAKEMAKVFADSEMIPKGYRGKWQDVLVAMQLGAEVGLSPMAALQSIRVINGQPGLYGDGFLAVIQSSPLYVKHEEYYVTGQGEQVDHVSLKDLEHDETMAVSTFWRKGAAKPFTETFSIGDAKKAHLINKDGPWKEYPARMMKWRARAWAGRDGFSDALRGMKMIAELEDLPVIDIEPSAESRVVEMPQRRSEKQTEPAPETPTPDPREPAPPPAKPAKPKPATPEPEPTDTEAYDAMVIIDTTYMEKDGQPYYKITAKKEKAPLAFDFITRDKAVGALAESAAGSPQTFTLRYKVWKRPDKKPVKELVDIAAS